MALGSGQAVDCPSMAAALERAEALSRDPANAGAIAFFRCGDANLREFTEDVLIRAFGNVPNDMRDP